jgi:ABC-type multidrug transport system fused ATPase/permease subunit
MLKSWKKLRIRTAQIPYIAHGTIRDTILFGLAYIPSRYTTVVEQCSLLSDFATFEHGDLQEIGASGVTLSGGQRARISLARAVYSRAGTILIDDVLSSLDATTSQYIYAHCLKGDLLKERRVVMVSHNVSLLLPAADLVIQLKDGAIARAGPAKEVGKYLLEDTNREAEHTIETLQSLIPPVIDQAKSLIGSGTSTRRIYKEEHQERGNVNSSHYRFVIKNVGGIWYWTAFLAILVAAQSTYFVTRVVLQHWTADPMHNDYWIMVWVGVAIARILLTSLRWFWLYGNEKGGFTMRAASRMHDIMVERILHAPLRYFDRTPEGRILNRFSKDIQRVDGELPDGIGRTIMETLAVFANLVVLGLNLPVSCPHQLHRFKHPELIKSLASLSL